MTCDWIDSLRGPVCGGMATHASRNGPRCITHAGPNDRQVWEGVRDWILAKSSPAGE